AGHDLAGAEFLVTGGSGGIGFETARALAAHGARVTLAARDRTKLESARARLLAEVPDARVDEAIVDLADLASVRTFAADFLAERDHLDVLVNNAGVMFPPLTRTADGFELQFGTNHLAHFLLTALLFPLLRASAADVGGAGRVRVVNVSSEGHRRGGVDLGDPNFIARDYDKFVGYGQSKTANILFSRELDRRAESVGVHAFSLHPGRIATDLGRHMTHDDMVALMERAKAASSTGMPDFKSIPQGAATTVYAAVTEELDQHGGAYLSDCALAEPADWARDDATAKGLWDLSESLVSEQWSP
ncbi:MAG TPA: SDR family NAD(P)-dependent oxidoreductase, partial [Acidimicrobiia bacterium]